jgi:hypothetical protein
MAPDAPNRLLKIVPNKCAHVIMYTLQNGRTLLFQKFEKSEYFPGRTATSMEIGNHFVFKTGFKTELKIFLQLKGLCGVQSSSVL